MEYINLIRILILLSLGHAFIGKPLRGRRNYILIGILLTCFLTEVAVQCLMQYNINNGFAMTISIVIHHTLWLILLFEGFEKKTALVWNLFLFYSLAAVNLFAIEGFAHFNYSTFVVGAFMYLLVFIRESFIRLQKEELSFFTTNNYLLLCAPLLFFIGLSFLFGFRSRTVTSIVVFNNVILYDVVIYFVNISYYALINLYLYKEKKQIAHA